MEWTRKHLLGLDELSREEILFILQTAEGFKEVSRRSVKKVPALRGRVIVNLFFEVSTRTRVSFELAADMADRYILLYEQRRLAPSVEGICHMLSPSGLQTIRPGSQSIVMPGLDADEDYLERFATAMEVDKGIADNGAAFFMLWFSKFRSVHCELDRVEDELWETRLGIAGTDTLERSDLRDTILDYMNHRLPRGVQVRGFVYDPDGRAPDYPWRNFFSGHKVLAEDGFQYGMPNLILIPRDLKSKLGISRATDPNGPADLLAIGSLPGDEGG
jgi:hypothetical protein